MGIDCYRSIRDTGKLENVHHLFERGRIRQLNTDGSEILCPNHSQKPLIRFVP